MQSKVAPSVLSRHNISSMGEKTESIRDTAGMQIHHRTPARNFTFARQKPTRRGREEKKAIMEPTRVEQSLWIRFALRAAHILEGPGRRLLRLNAPHLLAAACRRTHLHDFGDPALQEPLRRLVHSLEGEARLNFIGRLAAREDLTHMLMNRLKMARDRQLYPDIAAEQIRRP